MPVYDGRFLHRFSESYQLCLPTCSCFVVRQVCVSDRKGSVDFMMYKPKVLLTEVGAVPELIPHTHIRIQGTGTSKVHVAIMLISFVLYM